MLIAVLTWSVIFLMFLTLGFTTFYLLGKVLKNDMAVMKPDELFFTGFLVLSGVLGALSISFAMTRIILIIVGLCAFILFYLFAGKITGILKDLCQDLISLKKGWLIAFVFLVFTLMCAAAYEISFEDSLTYHAQNIQWIQKYSVVPGLGNLHGRFAFNNMFFVASSIFSYKIGETLIYPLNGLCFLVLSIKLFSLFKEEFQHGKKWKGIFYILLFLMGTLILIPEISSPAPDIICDILVIYSIILLFRKIDSEQDTDVPHFILICLVILSCVTYKISSVLLAPVLLFFLKSEIKKKFLVVFFVGSFILLPYLIRNYYLSGYIVYPFPSIDLFSPDWKIPKDEVSAMKLEIESFAKIVGVPYSEIDAMPFYEWMHPWFKAKGFNTKLFLVVNLFSFVIFLVMMLKREKFAWIFLIIYLNLLFWLSTAPDPRFVFGFLLSGFSLTFAYIIKISEDQKANWLKYLSGLLIILAVIIGLRRIKFFAAPFKEPKLFAIPAIFKTVPTEVKKADNFSYRMPVNIDDYCYDTEIPCVTYLVDGIMLRGEDIQDGFRIGPK